MLPQLLFLVRLVVTQACSNTAYICTENTTLYTNTFFDIYWPNSGKTTAFELNLFQGDLQLLEIVDPCRIDQNIFIQSLVLLNVTDNVGLQQGVSQIENSGAIDATGELKYFFQLKYSGFTGCIIGPRTADQLRIKSIQEPYAAVVKDRDWLYNAVLALTIVCVVLIAVSIALLLRIRKYKKLKPTDPMDDIWTNHVGLVLDSFQEYVANPPDGWEKRSFSSEYSK